METSDETLKQMEAQTGHTLRLLDFPNTLAKGLSKIIEIKKMLGPMLENIGAMMGGGLDFKKMGDKLDEMMPLITEMQAEFKDPKKTTFVCVMIAEFLSLYETERLIQ